MSIFALADLHLAFSVPEKSMEVFGKRWENYSAKIETAWKGTVTSQDLVLIPGDISWAKDPEQAAKDLNWIHALPGTKLLLRGNHDYWWSSLSRIKQILPSSMHLIQNNVFNWKGVTVGGSRLWDTDEYSFEGCIEYIENPKAKKMEEPEDPEEQEKIFVRELGRLEMSLKALDKHAKTKIAMTHYPPIGPSMQSSRATLLLEKYGVHTCVFGHLHNVKKDIPLFGETRGVRYILTAADYLDFKPKQIHPT